MQVVMAFMLLVMLFVIYPRASISVKRIPAVLETPLSIRDGTIAEHNYRGRGEIELRDVSFRYPGAEADTLKHISFHAKKGETIAVIGATGNGKSTLVNLIERFYDATEGEVLVDGVNVKSYSLSVLRNKIGYASQRVTLFSGTVRENVAFGDSGHAMDTDVVEAVYTAQAAEFVEKMESGAPRARERSGSPAPLQQYLREKDLSHGGKRMFGHVAANVNDLSPEEKERYHAVYCGLCHTLGERHGFRARLGLTYDLTFLTLLLSSLYEPEETTGESRCLTGEGAAAMYAAPQFTGSGDAAEAAQIAASFPNAADGTVLRTIGTPKDGVMEASHPEYGTSLWYNSGMYEEPSAPHDTVYSADGVGWYAMQPHNVEAHGGTVLVPDLQHAVRSMAGIHLHGLPAVSGHELLELRLVVCLACIAGRVKDGHIEERDADTVKCIRIPKDGGEMFVISIVEHESRVNHRMPFKLLQYMTFIPSVDKGTYA